jgi:hypothetical protein
MTPGGIFGHTNHIYGVDEMALKPLPDAELAIRAAGHHIAGGVHQGQHRTLVRLQVSSNQRSSYKTSNQSRDSVQQGQHRALMRLQV